MWTWNSGRHIQTRKNLTISGQCPETRVLSRQGFGRTTFLFPQHVHAVKCSRELGTEAFVAVTLCLWAVLPVLLGRCDSGSFNLSTSRADTPLTCICPCHNKRLCTGVRAHTVWLPLTSTHPTDLNSKVDSDFEITLQPIPVTRDLGLTSPGHIMKYQNVHLVKTHAFDSTARTGLNQQCCCEGIVSLVIRSPVLKLPADSRCPPCSTPWLPGKHRWLASS